nr:PAS domain-containing protein [Caulobacter sp. 17J65-9]
MPVRGRVLASPRLQEGRVFHTNTQRVIDYWRSLRTGPSAPSRAAFDPMVLHKLLPQVFMVGRGAGGLPLRLAGDEVIQLHGRSLRAAPFLSMWASPSRAAARDAAVAAVRGVEPVVIMTEGRTQAGDRLGLEILLAPLVGPSGVVDRLLGLHQPTTGTDVLEQRPLHELHARLTVYAGGGDAKLAASVAETGRLRA